MCIPTAAPSTFRSPMTVARECWQQRVQKEWFESWVTKRLANDADAEDGIALLRESYDEVRGR